MSLSAFSREISENPAIVILGHPASEKLKVSEDVSALGLRVLKAAPSEIIRVGLPDYHQVGYGEYKASLPAFMFSLVNNVKITAHDSTYELLPQDLPDDLPLMPIRPPSTYLAFQEKIDPETASSIKAYYDAVPLSGAAGNGFAWQPEDWDVLPKLQKYRPLKTVRTYFGYANPQALLYSKRVTCWISAILHLHKYPAFTDVDHMISIIHFEIEKVKGDDGMDVDNIQRLRDHYEAEVIGSATAKNNLAKHRMLIDMSYDKVTRKDVKPWLEFEDFTDTYPQTDGLFLPYYSCVAKEDPQMVPNFIDRWIAKSTAGTLEDVVLELRTIRAEWGVVASTEFGRQMSHIVACLEMALQAQARCLPIFQGSDLIGCVFSGGGYSIDVGREGYRPVSRANLMLAWPKIGLHQAALDGISRLISGPDRELLSAVKTMWELHLVLIHARIEESNKDQIKTLAKRLSFRDHKEWGVNISSFEKAFTLIRLPMPLTIEHQLPIHYSMILSTDKTELVWSCFGGMAPSFRVPGGKRFKLTEDMTYDLPKGGRGRDVETIARLVRVAVHDKSLDIAIRDLRSVMDDKSIDNPLVMPKVKRSESSHNRAFVGEEGGKLLELLREFTGVVIEKGRTKEKRSEDDIGGESSKKRRGDMDY